MIPKTKSTDIPEGLAEQLSQSLTKEEPVLIQTVTEKKREGQINFSVPLEIKTKWKILFAKSNVKMTQGLIFAMEHLIQEIDDGEVVLTVGGVMKKRM